MKLYEHPDILKWLPAAESGDAEAQYELGNLMRNGYIDWEIVDGYDVDDWDEKLDEIAGKWIYSAAKQGHVKAQLAMADKFAEYGESGLVVHWASKAVNGGGIQAFDYLAFEYIWGSGRGARGPERDLDYGFFLLRKGVEAGDEWSLNSLIYNFERGLKNSIEFDKRCMLGSAYSMLELMRYSKEDVRKKINDAVDGLSEEARSTLQTYWDEISCLKKGGEFSLHDAFFEYPMDNRRANVYIDDSIIETYGQLDSERGDGFETALMQRMIIDQAFNKNLGHDVPVWIEMPAKDGIAAYQYVLGAFYNPARYMPKSEFNAYADFVIEGRGTSECKFKGFRYVKSDFVPEPDFDKAKYWLAEAARQEFKPAVRELVKLYDGAPEKVKYSQEAIEWIKKGEEMGL